MIKMLLSNNKLSVASGLYEIIGVLGYVTFGDNVNSNVMSMYPGEFKKSLSRSTN